MLFKKKTDEELEEFEQKEILVGNNFLAF